MISRAWSSGRPPARPGANVNVRIPVTNTKGQLSGELLRALSSDGGGLNATAMFTLDKVSCGRGCARSSAPAIDSPSIRSRMGRDRRLTTEKLELLTLL
jgi:hypothetical protein